jgi:enamine deaminase RidA (YjgF/YER057c/UK114 family)
MTMMTGRADAGPQLTERVVQHLEVGEREGVACASRVVTPSTVELRLLARPAHGGGFAAQARSMYGQLRELLRAQDAAPLDVLTEKVFLSDVAAQAGELQEARAAFYGREDSGAPRPAATLVQQPPLGGGHLCEVQVLAQPPVAGIRPGGRTIQGPDRVVVGRTVESGGTRHLYLAGITGEGDGWGFAGQAVSMFERAEELLQRSGLGLGDVVRTWIYLADIDRDYDTFNQVRRALFRSRGIKPPPASTGIQGVPYPADRLCGLDLCAMAGPGRRRVVPCSAPTLNEAPAYGSDFSRGMRVDLPDRSVLFISGTASIDTEGRVVHVGDIEGQVERMLLNVERLLQQQGATGADLVSAITYLKRPEFVEPFLRVARRHPLPPRLPNTLCHADICRPDWLCEMEAIAVIAS